MDDAHGVSRAQAVSDAGRQLDGALHRKIASLDQSGQVLRQELHRDVVLSLSLADVEDANYVRVVDSCRQRRLTLEPPQVRRITGQAGVEDLESDESPPVRVEPAIDRPL